MNENRKKVKSFKIHTCFSIESSNSPIEGLIKIHASIDDSVPYKRPRNLIPKQNDY